MCLSNRGNKLTSTRRQPSGVEAEEAVAVQRAELRQRHQLRPAPGVAVLVEANVFQALGVPTSRQDQQHLTTSIPKFSYGSKIGTQSRTLVNGHID